MAGQTTRSQNIDNSRSAVRRRARQLKQELLAETIKLSEDAVSSYEQVVLRVRRRGGGLVLPCSVALLLGAFSMTIPVPSKQTLHGKLQARASPVVLATPSQCNVLQLDKPATVTIDVPGQSDLVLRGRIVSLSARPKISDASGPVCRVELQLLPRGDEIEVLKSMPLGAAIHAELPTTRSWLGAVQAQLPPVSHASPSVVDRASASSRSALAFTLQLYRSYVAPRLP